MSKITLGVVQCAFSDDMNANIKKIEPFIRDAAKKGAQVILTPELFQGYYFCTSQDEKNFDRAYPAAEHPCVVALQKLAKELGVVLPVSIYERDGSCLYNSVVIVDADGSILGTYRKTHIPDGPGYQEKFYFRPGDTGFKAWKTKFGTIGVGICWDQWFPESARQMMLKGADILLYPTAIGSEPHNAALDTKDRWQLAQRGHAVSNVVPVAASNRVGTENGQVFYGSSFISDQAGNLVEQMDRTQEGVLVHTFDLGQIKTERSAWGFFRDRREDQYTAKLGAA
ncbi:MAG TPA: N-carbamoylputrescine amidase [Alphaproteobacteria bacterium]|nr:N-carbamoylputrescine amidase [Alphaproteobacteria bacterium]